MTSNPSRRQFLGSIAAGVALAASPYSCQVYKQPPNIVLIFLDDSGWSDYPPFGRSDYSMSYIQQLAKEGCSYQNFYVPQAICSASRASLLSGCYPGRTGVVGAHGPGGRGLEPSFQIIPELLKEREYHTGIFGKWHIGDQPDTRPWARGFDEASGLMVSNDMWRYHPENPEYWGQWPLSYWENGHIVINDITHEDQNQLTTWYTEHAVDFIRRNRTDPFFLYVPHAMPHVPLHCSDKFKGKSGAGLYGDVMMELDWSVGQINQALKDNGLDDNTIVILTSDNGPWISYGNHAGETPFREAKATSFDGGTRSACIIKYPGNIRPGSQSNRTFCSIDLLPTLCAITGAPLPQNQIDGKNVWEFIAGKTNAPNPHAYYAFSTVDKLEAVMTGDGRWKLHLPHDYRSLIETGKNGRAGKYRQIHIDLSLFDMENDPFESKNVLHQHSNIAAMLQDVADSHINQFYAR